MGFSLFSVQSKLDRGKSSWRIQRFWKCHRLICPSKILPLMKIPVDFSYDTGNIVFGVAGVQFMKNERKRTVETGRMWWDAISRSTSLVGVASDVVRG
jgi:hypothetical protein